MATMAAGSDRVGAKQNDRLVIFASSLGTVFEWYDFYIYGTLGVDSRQQVLLRRRAERRLHLHAARVRGRLRGTSVRRAGVRPPRRHRRPQVHLPRHHDADGHRHVPDRRAADLRVDRHRGADPADRAASRAGPRARRRVRRCGDLRRRACADGQARPLHLVDPDHRDTRPVHGAAGHPRHPHRDGRSRVQRLGLAHSVPALRRPARRLDLDPAAARRVARLPEDEGRRQAVEGAAHGSLRQLGQRQDRASSRCSARRPAKRSCGTADSSTRCSS